MNESFQNLGIGQPLAEALAKMGITEPTDIQQEAIPAVLTGRDVVGRSATGTGKTLAYLLPLVAKIDPTRRENQAIILAPTHELAIQIQRHLEALLSHAGLPVTAAPLIGNANIMRQIDKLKEKPHILIGSAGRILELIQKRKITIAAIKTIVLDEADRLLDEHNRDAVKAIIRTTLKERQILLFSATITEQTLEQARSFLRDPALVAVEGRPDVAATIRHMYVVCEKRDKVEVLRKLVHSTDMQQGLVFLNRSEDMEMMASKLNFHGLVAACLHGTFTQAERKKALDDFRRGRALLLVASDVAARGLDIRGIDFVYNLDLPEDPELYLHRVGRTGRAGDIGYAMSIATATEVELIHKYERVLGINIAPKFIRDGQVRDASHRTLARPQATAKPQTLTKPPTSTKPHILKKKNKD